GEQRPRPAGGGARRAVGAGRRRRRPTEGGGGAPEHHRDAGAPRRSNGGRGAADRVGGGAPARARAGGGRRAGDGAGGGRGIGREGRVSRAPYTPEELEQVLAGELLAEQCDLGEEKVQRLLATIAALSKPTRTVRNLLQSAVARLQTAEELLAQVDDV